MNPNNLFLFFLLLLLSCGKHETINPLAVQGKLDLQNWSLENSATINGEWEFYWNQWIISDAKENIDSKNILFLKTQEAWTDHFYKGNQLPREGFASYKMTVKVKDPTDLWIRIPNIASAYRFFCNGNLLYESGKPAKTSLGMKPYIKPIDISIPLDVSSSNLELVFEISNFQNDNPGFWHIPKIGKREVIQKNHTFAVANDLFLFGALAIMGFYHLGLSYFHRSEKAIFYFAFFSYMLSLRIILTGERYILDLFPSTDWEFLFRMEFLTLFLLPISFTVFIRNLYKEESFDLWIKILSIISLIFSLSLFFPIAQFTKLARPFIIITVVSSIFVIITTIRAFLHKRQDSELFLLGVILLVSGSFWDLLRDAMNLRGISLSPFGFLGFVFTQALVLSSRLAYHFKKSETLSKSLKSSNEELTTLKENLEEKVEERTFELNHALTLLKNDLSIAHKIQSKIIPDPQIQFPELEIQFLYQPMDAVGGDIFDISEIKPGIFRIFLADALGHGVQAALLTMAIKSEYESVKKIGSIENCMKDLSYNFHSKFQNLNTYFSAVICDLNVNNNSLHFVSAGHPSQILQYKNTIEDLSQTAHIIGLNQNLEVKMLKFEWKPGSRLFLFSDGLFEHFNKHKEMFGENRILIRIENSSKESLKKTIFAIENDILEFLGQNKIMDDLTLIAIERK